VTGPGTSPHMALTVLEPGSAPRRGTLHLSADGATTLGPAGGSSGDRMYLTPGWVDLHAHVFDGTTRIGIHPDRAGLSTGVHLVVDAGSAGQMTVRGLVDYVLPTAQTPVRLLLNIGSHGLVHLRETADISFMDVDATIAAVGDNAGVVRGIKVRSSGAIVGAMGLQPLQLGRLVAREVGLPLMVHIGEAPPPIEDVLALVGDGDVITHCFHGKTGRPWLAGGAPIPALRAALDRGALLDVGHGAASFDVTVAGAAVQAGFAPATISTDLHARTINGPVYDLAGVMTKMLHCGLALEDVVAAVTTTPRRILREPVGPLVDGHGNIKQATVFRLVDQAPAGRPCVDSAGRALTPERHIVPVGVVVDGRYREVTTQNGDEVMVPGIR